MTVKNKLEKTITDCESVLADLKSFAQETDNKNAKQMFQKLAQSEQGILDTLNSRLEYIKQEEAQYR